MICYAKTVPVSELNIFILMSSSFEDVAYYEVF